MSARAEMTTEQEGEIHDDPASKRVVTSEDVQALIDEICENPGTQVWERGVPIQLGSKGWRPSAVTVDRQRLLYVFMQEELPRFVSERLTLAVAQSLRVTVALPIAALFKAEVCVLLAELDADVIVVDDYVEERRLRERSILLALADIGVPVDPQSRRLIGRGVLAKISSGTTHEKGRRLEALLAFLFSQIQDLKVVEHNFRTETEEIDLVLQIDNFSPRVWQRPGVPFILVEAKNRVEKASQQVMSVLIMKLQTKRGAADIGFLVSLAGFTEDARVQELRFSTQDSCVVMIGRDELVSLIEADDPDGVLEGLVTRALLR